MTSLPGLAAAALLALSLAIGCGSGTAAAGGIAQYYGNYHKTGWISEHPGQALAGIDACTKCHEFTVLRVGSGIPSCMTTGCHHKTGYGDPVVHGVRAKMAANTVTGGSLASCQICHAKDFSGGPAANACATCHSVKAPHPPKPWRIANGSVFTHSSTDISNAVTCVQCHYPGSPNNPANHPAAPAPAGTQPGCYNATLCHDANMAPHPRPFLQGQTDTMGNGHMNATAASFAADCKTCHAYAGTSPMATAPLCNVCHQVADPTLLASGAGTCLSCHAGTAGLPKGPGGSAFPSIAGAHVKHMSLATQLTCDTCHAGGGTGSATHYTNANARIGAPVGPASVSMDPVFTAKTGGNPTFSPSALSCSNVSCHGGQVTPSWQSGLINASTQCTACHSVVASAGTTTQYNDAFGRHNLGSHNATKPANAIACTTCHNMSNGSPGALAHFKYLGTQSVDGVATGAPPDQMPSGTIVFDPAIVTSGTYTVTSSTQGNGGCALTCHSHIHVAAVNTWTASGAPHKVPFLVGDTDTQGNGHMTATAATFAADCGTCHAVTGTSPHAESPLCSSCHVQADPTVAATGVGTCLSCHPGTSGMPLGPTGTTFPSIKGSHLKHMSLKTALTCNTCHSGVGSGTATHYDNAKSRINGPTGPAVVNIVSTFNAQSGGTAAFNPASLSCNSVSCHGGKTTPNWSTGTIDSTSQCSLCHAIRGTVFQYNDAINRHAWGTHSTAATLDCTICHDMSAANTSPGVVNHFAELDTFAVSSTNKLPSGTVKFKLTSATYPITGAATYDVTTAPFVEGDGGCALTCHSMTHLPATNHWDAPKGSGIAHPSPFTYADRSNAGYSHQLVTQTQFDLECTLCHDANNASSTKTGPTCTKCHTLASPLASAPGTCLSCHVGANFGTMGPQGASNQAWPNLPGAHAKHVSLLTFTRTSPVPPVSLAGSRYPICEACHVGAVPGDTANTHYSNANKLQTTPKSAGPGSVSVAPIFNSQASVAGTVGTTSLTCTNISCHGGQTTPVWQTGTLTVNANTYCTACHTVGAAEYNAPIGRHSNPPDHIASCDTCHDMVTGHINNPARTVSSVGFHFKYLDIQAPAPSGVRASSPDLFPSDTIVFGNVTNGATGTKTYTVTTATEGNGGCALSCHTQTHTAANYYWKKP